MKRKTKKHNTSAQDRSILTALDSPLIIDAEEIDPSMVIDDIEDPPPDFTSPAIRPDYHPNQPPDSLINLAEFNLIRQPDSTCKIDMVYYTMTKELTIDRSRTLFQYSDRFGWDKRGADAMQTAVAILLAETNSEDFAVELHQERQIIGTFSHEGWITARESVYFWIDINHPSLLPQR